MRKEEIYFGCGFEELDQFFIFEVFVENKIIAKQ